MVVPEHQIQSVFIDERSDEIPVGKEQPLCIQFFCHFSSAIRICNGNHGIKGSRILSQIRTHVDVIDRILKDGPYDLQFHIQCWKHLLSPALHQIHLSVYSSAFFWETITNAWVKMSGSPMASTLTSYTPSCAGAV